MSVLTERQLRFVDEYVLTGNAMQSAIRAGYSEKYAKSNSYKLLENVGIKNLIEERREKAEEQLRQRFSFDAEVARKIMFQLMKDDNAPEAVRLSAAKDFLDRAGFKPVEKQEHSGSLDISSKSEVIGKYLKGDAE